MHKVFGVREMVNYIDRVGVYLVLVKDGKVDALLEDDHEFMWVDYNELVDSMYLEIQSWALV